MPAFASHWSGDTRAEIDAEHIDAATLKPGASGYSALTISAMQLAFDYYYRGMAIAKALPDRKLAKKVTDDLRETATTGWGFGVHDLEDAFKHLATNGGRWKDKLTRMYGGGGSGAGAINGQGVYTTALFTANFFAAIDDKVKEAAKLAEEHNQASNNLAEAAQKGDWNKVGTKQWEKVGEYLEKIKTVSEKLESILWLVPPQSDMGENVTRVIEIGNSYLNAIGDVRAALETFDKGMQAGLGAGPSLLIAALEKGMGQVPVIGAVYAQAIGLIPTIAAGFQRIAERQKSMLLLARVGPAAGQQMDW